ncbi:MAG: nicotinate-nucleotide adenylyltransferase [Anaerolineaceae bacterium]|nr:nicotinate-nucleotide adenylyltransferase [Anaerolineaceae bacterium]MDE0329401.1 nicotinate-nucleotide adenylyltransferase [Anaerolineaceae bacterium]
MNAVKRIGVLGGTFDPPHCAHLALARAVRDALNLDRLLFLPAADPPHKRGKDMSPASARLEMLELALAGHAGMCLSRLDVDRPGPQYSLDTMKLLRRDRPAASFWFVMGADSLCDFPAWYRPLELASLCRLAVVPRPGVCVQPDMHEAALPGLTGRVDMVDCAALPHASRDIVESLRAGGDVSGLVPPAVLDYIAARGLYRV